MQYKTIMLSLFDGGAGAGAAAAAGEGGGSSTGAENGSANGVRPEIVRRGKELGIEDEELLKSYQDAYDSRHKSDGSEDEKQEQQEKSENADSKEDTRESDFEALIKGDYHDAFNRRVHDIVDERLRAERGRSAQLKAQAQQGETIVELLRQKYPELKDSTPDELIKALRDDDETWRQRAIADGITAEEAKASFEQEKVQRARDARLEELEQQERVRALDMRMQALAKETQKEYPDFDLRAEFENPKFKMALDFIAAQNAQKNEQTGRNDEIFDLTYAYEMAHSDEIRKNTIKRVSHATMSAMAQDIAANGRRISENVGRRGAPPEPTAIEDMSDEDFSALMEKVRNGTGRIPR